MCTFWLVVQSHPTSFRMGDTLVIYGHLPLMAQRVTLFAEDIVRDTVQSLMLPPLVEIRIIIFDHRWSTMPRQRLLLSPWGKEKAMEPPELFDPPLLIWTYQTTSMKSVLGYGRQVARQDSEVVV
jgi:hypothetical protein